MTLYRSQLKEFNFSAAKTKAIMVVAILFGAVVYVALNTVTAAVIPAGYGSWNEYIDAFWSLDGLSSLPTFNAAHTLLGDAGLVFLGVAVLAAVLSGIIGFYMATSRLLYSMAKEGVIPMWFGKLHTRYKTPANAIIFVMVVSLVAPFFGRTLLPHRGWNGEFDAIDLRQSHQTRKHLRKQMRLYFGYGV